MKRSPLTRKTRLKPRSAKQARVDAARRILRQRLQADDPMCRRCRREPGTDLHERLMRSQAATALDESVIALICRNCHSQIHAQPSAARAAGWLIYRADLGGAA